MNNCFEKVKRFENDDTIHLPVRKTANSAGYDFEVAEDTLIPPLFGQEVKAICDNNIISIPNYVKKVIDGNNLILNLAEAKQMIKEKALKPTLVPTGIKCKIDPDKYLELSVRSSCPLNSLLILANGVGIIDADYYSNPANDGEIFFQILNLSPYDIYLHKGDTIGQGIVKPYLKMDNDTATGERTGGFGSTSR